MKFKHAKLSSDEINPYAPSNTPIYEAVTPSVFVEAEPTSRLRCVMSLLLGSTSIIINFFGEGLFGFLIFFCPRLSPDRLRMDFLAFMLGYFGIAIAIGCLGFWLVRAELKVSRPTTAGATAVRFCKGSL